jgi:hypothetical protein
MFLRELIWRLKPRHLQPIVAVHGAEVNIDRKVAWVAHNQTMAHTDSITSKLYDGVNRACPVWRQCMLMFQRLQYNALHVALKRRSRFLNYGSFIGTAGVINLVISSHDE